MKTRQDNRGFTLIELMVVLVIVGILASFAIPRFSNAVHKTKASEFPTILTTIYNAEITARDETGAYAPLEDLDVDMKSIQDSKLFEYTVESDNWEESFVVVAKVKAPGIGNAGPGKKATIDQDGVRGGDTELLRYVKTWR